MIDKLTPWPGQTKTPGRRPGSEDDQGQRTYGTWRDQLKHEHRPARADARETAHLIEHREYECSRCGGNNEGTNMTCRLCGVRFVPLVVRAEQQEIPTDTEAALDGE